MVKRPEVRDTMFQVKQLANSFKFHKNSSRGTRDVSMISRMRVHSGLVCTDHSSHRDLERIRQASWNFSCTHWHRHWQHLSDILYHSIMTVIIMAMVPCLEGRHASARGCGLLAFSFGLILVGLPE